MLYSCTEDVQYWNTLSVRCSLYFNSPFLLQKEIWDCCLMDTGRKVFARVPSCTRKYNFWRCLGRDIPYEHWLGWMGIGILLWQEPSAPAVFWTLWVLTKRSAVSQKVRVMSVILGMGSTVFHSQRFWFCYQVTIT